MTRFWHRFFAGQTSHFSKTILSDNFSPKAMSTQALSGSHCLCGIRTKIYVLASFVCNFVFCLSLFIYIKTILFDIFVNI